LSYELLSIYKVMMSLQRVYCVYIEVAPRYL